MIAEALRGLLCVGCFGISLATCCGLLQHALPQPEVPQVKEKIDWLAAHPGDYTALFVGSSRVRQQVLPTLFDRLAVEHGLPMHSFNLGVDNLFSPEDGYLLDQALAVRLPHLRWVFLELSYFRSNFAGQSADTLRALYWHDAERTAWVWRQLAEQDWANLKVPKKYRGPRWRGWLETYSPVLQLFAEHGRLFAMRMANVGRGGAWLEVIIGLRRPEDPAPLLGPAGDGFVPHGTELVDWPAELAEYQQQLTALATSASRRRNFGPVPQRNLESMLAKIRAAGAEPVLFLAPTVTGLVRVPMGEVAPLWDFSDPRQYPQLFDPQHRSDPAHLNTRGAEIFTQLLAERFLPMAAEQR